MAECDTSPFGPHTHALPQGQKLQGPSEQLQASKGLFGASVRVEELMEQGCRIWQY